jgi:hypothetical protein
MKNRPRANGSELWSFLPLALNALVDLFPMNWDVLRARDVYSHLVALNPEDCNRDVVTDL